jgi:hypothetical protein
MKSVLTVDYMWILSGQFSSYSGLLNDWFQQRDDVVPG